MRTVIVAAFCMALSLSARADDLQPTVDEANGNWVAISFMDGSETKICVAASADKRFLLRADGADLEFRTSDQSWSLAADASGDVAVKVGTVQKTFHTTTLDATTLSAVVDADDITELANAMDKASTASITFGSKKTYTVSLSGSTRAMNSFRTCSAVHGFAKIGGSAGAAASPF